jgi:hypothetical protein
MTAVILHFPERHSRAARPMAALSMIATPGDVQAVRTVLGDVDLEDPWAATAGLVRVIRAIRTPSPYDTDDTKRALFYSSLVLLEVCAPAGCA